MTWSRVAPEVTRRIEVAGAGPADVLVDWLSAVILSAAAHGEVYGEVEVEGADEASAAGVVRGARFDPARHELRFDVKAATYHRLVCEEIAGGFHARVIFDL
jgi:SHS2 domain-containing protein